MFNELLGCNSIACAFDKTPTTGTLLYQLFLIIFFAVTILILSKYKKKVLLHWSVMAIGALIFEFFTSPMRLNLHLGEFSYMYHGVSWVLTVGFTTLIFLVVTLVELFFKKWREIYRYLISIGFLWPLLVITEKYITTPLNIRLYAPETALAFRVETVPFSSISVLELLYTPVFASLIIAFYKYFSFYIDKKPLVPKNKKKHLRKFLIVTLAVLLFELVVGSMVNNVNFPGWSYIFHDITFILTGTWVAIVWFADFIIDKYLIHKNQIEKFIYTLALITILNTPIEAWLMQNGFRVYGQSAVANFSGFNFPLLNVPVEVIFAVPFYFALVLGFVNYISATLDNRE